MKRSSRRRTQMWYLQTYLQNVTTNLLHILAHRKLVLVIFGRTLFWKAVANNVNVKIKLIRLRPFCFHVCLLPLCKTEMSCLLKICFDISAELLCLRYLFSASFNIKTDLCLNMITYVFYKFELCRPFYGHLTHKSINLPESTQQCRVINTQTDKFRMIFFFYIILF